MTNESYSFNLQKAHKLNLKITGLLVFLIVLTLVVNHGIVASKLYIAAGVTVFGLAVINYFMKYSDFVKALIFSMLPGFVVYVLFIVDGYALNKHYLLFITLVMATIYFNSKILAIYGAVLVSSILLLYIVLPESLLGENTSLMNFLTVFFIYNGITYMLNKLNEWGGELIADAKKGEKETGELLQQSNQLVATIEQSAHTLAAETDDLEASSNSLAYVSNTILMSTQQIAQSVQNEADSIVAMHHVMHDSQAELAQTVYLSQGAMQQSQQVNEQLLKNTENVQQVTKHMDELSDSMNVTVSTMEDLQQSLQTVNDLLGAIKNIADQTNLLALNAAIEAARAGEAGMGFAVVADEVRKLAEESAVAAAQITEVTSELFAKSTAAQEQSVRGQSTALKGQSLLQDIATVFNDVKLSSDISNTNVAQSLNAIEKVSKQFTQLINEIDTLSAVSQQNSAATEEIVSSIHEENQLLLAIVEATGTLQKLNQALIALTK